MIARNAKKTFVKPIKLTPKQADFRRSKAWLTGLVAGRGSGKTFIGALHISQSAKRGQDWLTVSPDNNMIRSTTLPTFVEVVKRTGQYIRHVTTPTPCVTFRTIDGGTARLYFRGAEKPDKLRGGSFAGVWFDEASIISKEAFDIAIGTCRFRGEMGPVLCTFTPRGFKHWTFGAFFQPVSEDKVAETEGVRFFKGKPFCPVADTYLVQCSTRDNYFAPEEFADRVGSNYSSVFRQQEIDGDYVEIAGTMFQREWFRYVDEAPRDCQRVRYWDKACLIAGTQIETINGLKPIESVVAGDLVSTRNGWRQVQWSGFTKTINKVCTVLFSNGSQITGTCDHMVWTKNRNWVELASLGDGDYVVSSESYNSCPENETNHWNRWSSTDCGTLENQIEITSTQTHGTLSLSDTNTGHCIETSGSTPTEVFPMAVISTTLTETATTTSYRICNASLLKSTSRSIRSLIEAERLSLIRSIEKKHTELYGVGLSETVEPRSSRKLVPLGALQRGRIKSLRLTLASSAGRNSSRVLCSAPSAVLLYAGGENEERKKKRSIQGLARFAVHSSKVIAGKRLVRIHASKLQDKRQISVYDLTVKDDHEFFANGILVHNSTPGDGCYTAGVLLAKDRRGIYYVEHVVRGQWGALDRNQIIKATAQSDSLRYGGEVITYIEREGAGSGKDVTDALIRELAEYPVYEDLASASAMVKVGGVLLPGDAKIRRASPLSAQAEAGNLRIVNANFCQDFLDEIAAFPNFTFCDQVDAAAAAYLKLAKAVPDHVVTSRETVAADVGWAGHGFQNTDTTSTSSLLGALPWH